MLISFEAANDNEGSDEESPLSYAELADRARNGGRLADALAYIELAYAVADVMYAHHSVSGGLRISRR